MPSHRLLIRRCAIATWIGVYEHEQALRTRLLFDVDLDIDARLAAAGDHIDDTVDYGRVVEDLRACLYDKRYHLLEALADFVADRILQRYSVVRVRLTVSKLAVLEDVDSVGVEVERYPTSQHRSHERTIAPGALHQLVAGVASSSPQAPSVAYLPGTAVAQVNRQPA